MVGLIITLICLLASTACSQLAPRPQAEQQGAKTVGTPKSAQQDRTAIPDITGCTRDQTTFYRGRVLLFRRTPKSITIAIRTEWDTTEKLSYSTKEDSVEFRLQNRAISASEFRQIESRVKDRTAEVHATVWVCQVDGSQKVKIIDWEPADGKTHE